MLSTRRSAIMSELQIILGHVEALVEEFGEEHINEAGASGDCQYLTYRDEDGKELCYSTLSSLSGVTTTPCCIVGHILHREGVPHFELHAVEGTSADSIVHRVEKFNETAPATMLSEMQSAQDNGRPWGDLISIAEKHIKLAQEAA